MVSAFPVSFLFPKWQTLILAAVSCLFDASSATFAVFAPVIHLNYVSRQHLFLYYAGGAVVVYFFLVLQWSFVPTDSNSNDTPSIEADTLDDERPLVHTNTIDSQLEADQEEDDSGEDSHHSPMWDLSVFQQLHSFEYFFAVAFCSIQQLRANTYIGLNDEVLKRMGDVDGQYINIFSYALPSGVVFIPIIGFAVDRLGLVGALHATNALGVVYGTLVLVDHLPVQLGTFLAFTGYRAFLYSVMSTFNAQVFGFKTLGRITGFVFTSSAIFQLLQYPIVDSIDTIFHNDPFWPQVFLVSLSGIIIPLVIYFQCRSRGKSERSGSSIVNGAHSDLHSPLVSSLSPRGKSGSHRKNSSQSSTRSLRRSSSFLRSPSKHTDRNGRLK